MEVQGQKEAAKLLIFAGTLPGLGNCKRSCSGVRLAVLPAGWSDHGSAGHITRSSSTGWKSCQRRILEVKQAAPG